MDQAFLGWLELVRARHLQSLSFAELRKGVQALSRLYVEERSRMTTGDVLRGAGKRAAFACFYSPLHYLLVRDIVTALGAHAPAPRALLDLGCGLGVAGAAWALASSSPPSVRGIERHPWAAAEGRWSLRALGVRGKIVRGTLDKARPPRRGEAVVVAFTANELDGPFRERLLGFLLASRSRGAGVLVVEPIARRIHPWWERFSRAFRQAGGREDTWRFPTTLPPFLAELDRAAGLDHHELTARSLYFEARPQAVTKGNRV